MSHYSVRKFIEDTAKSLRTDIKFYYARTSDFNADADVDVDNINIVLDPITATPEYATDGVLNYMKSWQCNMAFYKKDTADSVGSQHAEILDATDEIVDNFVNKLNRYSYDSDTVLIQGINQTPFIKATSKVLTGHILTFTLVVQDTFNYCAIECEIPNPNEC